MGCHEGVAAAEGLILVRVFFTDSCCDTDPWAALLLLWGAAAAAVEDCSATAGPGLCSGLVDDPADAAEEDWRESDLEVGGLEGTASSAKLEHLWLSTLSTYCACVMFIGLDQLFVWSGWWTMCIMYRVRVAQET